MSEKLYRSVEVAKLLDVSLVTVTRLRLSGRLGFVRIGRSVRFKPEHIDEFLARQELKPTPRVSSSAGQTAAAAG
jgi:excisionase family DNA binding protein